MLRLAIDSIAWCKQAGFGIAEVIPLRVGYAACKIDSELGRGTTVDRLVIGLLGAAGVVVLLLGLLADTYEFMLGLVIAIGIWLVSGLLARYWGVPKWRLSRH